MNPTNPYRIVAERNNEVVMFHVYLYHKSGYKHISRKGPAVCKDPLSIKRYTVNLAITFKAGLSIPYKVVDVESFSSRRDDDYDSLV